jgi:hypothetical protein
MSDGSPPTAVEGTRAYPLSSRNPGDAGWIIRWVALALAALVTVGIVEAVKNTASGTHTGSLVDPAVLGIVAILCVVLGLCLHAFVGLAPGAKSCIWSTEGFHLLYGSRRTRTFRWDDTGFSCELWEVHSSTGTTYSISTGIPFQTPLSQEVFGLILGEARRRGYNVVVRRSGRASGPAISLRIRAPPARF